MHDTTKDPVEAQSLAQNADTQEDSAPSPSFNVFRFRKMDEESQDFYDPVTDILNILPEAIQNTMQVMEGMLYDDPEFSKACDMAYNVHQLFQIRLIEQKDDIDVVLGEFIKAFHDSPAKFRAMFTEILFTNLMVMWAVAQRRTSAGKPKKLVESKDTMALGSLMAYLLPSAQEAVRRDTIRTFSDALKELKTDASDEAIGFMDEDNNIVLDDAKRFVASIIPVKDGPRAWSTIAKILSNRETNDIRDVAAKETYPEYKKRHDKD